VAKKASKGVDNFVDEATAKFAKGQGPQSNRERDSLPGARKQQGLQNSPPLWYEVGTALSFTPTARALSMHQANSHTFSARCRTTRKRLENWRWGKQRPAEIMLSDDFLLSPLRDSQCEVCSVIYHGYQAFYSNANLPEKPTELSYSYSIPTAASLQRSFCGGPSGHRIL
jgi:hypothetical protein